MNPGESRRFVLRAIPRQGGTGRMLANVNASNDSDSRNNRAETGDLTVSARRDAGLELNPTFRLVPVGVPTELTFLVKAGGLEPINNVVVTLYPGRTTVRCKSVDVDGVACVVTNQWTCTIGTMDPGAQLCVARQRAVPASAGSPGHGANMSFNLTADDDAIGAKQYGTVLVVARQAVDVSLGWTSSSANFVGRNIRITASLHSAGIDVATNVSVSLEVPAPVEVVAVHAQPGRLRHRECSQDHLYARDARAGAGCARKFRRRRAQRGTRHVHRTFHRDGDQRRLARKQCRTTRPSS